MNALSVSYYADIVAFAKRLQPHDPPSLVKFQRDGHARAVRFGRQLKRVVPPQTPIEQSARRMSLNACANPPR